MEEVTLDQYLKAQKLMETHKVCGNWNGGKSGCGCNQVFKLEDVTRTVMYGQTYYWCSKCYDRIKND